MASPSTIRYNTVTNPSRQYGMIQEGRQAGMYDRKQARETPLGNRISK